MISIVMAYYNRKQHLINTLWGISKSKYNNFEVIVVDDCSDENQRIEDLEQEFNFLKIIRINKENKNHVNPSIPLNIAMGYTKGDIIILQNPECLHNNDVLDYVSKNMKKNKYMVFSTVNKDVVGLFKDKNWDEYKSNSLIEIDINDNSNNQWYCHKKFRPKAYNFCAAIMREDLKELNGFDERYAFGIERDDVEFLMRIERKNMDIVFVDSVIVIHQTHTPFYYINEKFQILRNINHSLFAKTTAIENIIKANPNKSILK